MSKINKNIENSFLKIFKKHSSIRYNKNFIEKKILYLEEGYIDSFSLISFVEEVENKFKIKFSNKDKVSKKFKTLDGVLEIIKTNLN